MNDSRSFFKNMFKIGTPECAVTSAVIAMLLALLVLLVGFWKALLIALVMLLGAFLGGVKNKRDSVSAFINRIFPPKSTVPYKEKNEKIAQAIREARERENAADQPAGDTENNDTEA